jgi:hypothetical protein
MRAFLRSSVDLRGARKALGRDALAWCVAAVWLLGTLFAFWFFELRLPRVAWCGGLGL